MTMAGMQLCNAYGRLEMDAEMFDQPSPSNNLDFRQRLKKVDEELIKRDLASLKFLCRDIIPAAAQEDIRRGIDLFLELEAKGKLGPSNLKYLAECLVRIQRTDLLRMLGIDAHEFEHLLLSVGEDVSPYRKLLLTVAEDLTKKELSTIVYLAAPLLGLSKMKTSQLKTPFQVMLALEHGGCISPQDVTLLIGFLQQAGRPDLVEKSMQYQGSVSADDIEMLNEKAGGGPISLHPVPMFQETPVNLEPMNPSALPVAMVPTVTPQQVHPHDISGFNYGPEGEELQNIVVSANEASYNPDINSTAVYDVPVPIAMPNLLAGPTAGCDYVISPPPTEQMQYLHLADEDLPSYRMDRQPRGYCLIINNFKFEQSDDPDSKKMPDRHGTHVDAENLDNVFKRLGFMVEHLNNLSHTELVQQCSNYGRKNHSNFDCFVCCILTHGVKDHLYGSNGMKTPITEITSCFKALRCPGLRGKPKLFFIQACQGRDKQEGFPLEMDAPAGGDLETIPNEADFLLGYATVPGFVSYRSKVTGSWYITTLCDNLTRYGSRYDVLSIMTKVNEEVSLANAAMDDGRFKQIPAPMTTLRKKVYFR